jgi:hypothetical protein
MQNFKDPWKTEFFYVSNIVKGVPPYSFSSDCFKSMYSSALSSQSEDIAEISVCPCFPTTRHSPSHSTSSPRSFNFCTISRILSVSEVGSTVTITAAKHCSTGDASSDKYSSSHVPASSGISSIHIPASTVKYRVVRVIECVRPAWGVVSFVRPFGRDDVNAFTRDSFPDLGRPRISILRLETVIPQVVGRGRRNLESLRKRDCRKGMDDSAADFRTFKLLPRTHASCVPTVGGLSVSKTVTSGFKDRKSFLRIHMAIDTGSAPQRVSGRNVSRSRTIKSCPPGIVTQ